jgi:hypothetical protein
MWEKSLSPFVVKCGRKTRDNTKYSVSDLVRTTNDPKIRPNIDLTVWQPSCSSQVSRGYPKLQVAIPSWQWASQDKTSHAKFKKLQFQLGMRIVTNRWSFKKMKKYDNSRKSLGIWVQKNQQFFAIF